MIHTPGPWTVGRTFSTHNAPERFWETGVVSAAGRVAEGIGATREEAEANARLIAAAFELLDALKGLRKALYDADVEDAVIIELAAADAAIAKATGGPR